MGSNMTPDILQAALEERYRLEARLRCNPDFRRLEAVRLIIALYSPGAEVRAPIDPISYPEQTRSPIHSAPTPNPDFPATISASGPLTPPDPAAGSRTRRGSWS
jgi:hypothetical protein